MKNKTKTNIISIIPSLVIGMAIFITTKPYVAEALVDAQIDFIKNAEFETYTKENQSGFRQIVAKDQNGKVKFISDGNFTNANPASSKDKIVWMALIGSRWQIFMYDIISEKTIQLTFVGNNVNPKVSGNLIVWEGFTDGFWQIFLFDGLRIKQLTKDSSTKQSVDISGDSVVYSQKTPKGTWNIKIIDLKTGDITEPIINAHGKNPHIKTGKLLWTSQEADKAYINEYDLMTKLHTKKELTKNANDTNQKNTETQDKSTDQTGDSIEQIPITDGDNTQPENQLGTTEPTSSISDTNTDTNPDDSVPETPAEATEDEIKDELTPDDNNDDNDIDLNDTNETMPTETPQNEDNSKNDDDSSSSNPHSTIPQDIKETSPSQN